MAASGDLLVEASAREWVITVRREEAANELGEEWMSDAEQDYGPEAVELAEFRSTPSHRRRVDRAATATTNLPRTKTLRGK